MGQHHASRGILVFAAAASVLPTIYARADIIYRETFGHSVPNVLDPGPASADWAVHSGPSGIWRNVGVGTTNQANINASGGRTVTVFNSGSGVAQAGCNSRDDDMLNVNAGEPTAYTYDTIDDGIALNNANLRGNAYIAGTSNAWSASGTTAPTSQERRALLWTPEYSFNPANYAPGSIKFSWYQGNQNVLDPMHLSIRIGSQWFVQTNGITNTNSVTLANFFSNAELKEVPFSTAATGWSALNFDGNYDTVMDVGTDSSATAGLSIGAAMSTDLPAGAITGFGLLSNDPQVTGAGNRRFDSFTIQGTPLVGGAAVWNVDADGNWSTAGNWTSSVPNGVGAQATFGNKITAGRTVTVDSAQTVGTILFDNVNSYTVAGAAALTLDVSSGQAAITVSRGVQTISAPLVLNKDTTITVAGGGVLAITGNLTAAGKTITKAGAGFAQLNAIKAAALTVSGGFATISASATPNSPSGTSILNALSISAGSNLDLTNNSMVIDYTGAVGTLVGDTRTMLQDGRLRSSAFTASKNLGYGDNAVLNKSSFGGVTVDASSVLVKYTWGGDSNLDGQVDVTDLGALATSWQTSAPWTGGDFNYDGFVDVSDLGILATNWQKGVGGPLGRQSFDEALATVGLGGVSVPEPAGVCAICLAAAASRRRTRRGRRG